jgi:hypothetical protein
MSVIRPMQHEDLDWICDILETEARDRMKYPDPLNRSYVSGLWGGVLDRGTSLSFVSDAKDGFLLGMLCNDLYSGRPIGIEQLWYVKSGGSAKTAMQLLRAFITQAEIVGCARILTGDWQPIGGADLSKIYERLELTPLERYYKKELVCQ